MCGSRHHCKCEDKEGFVEIRAAKGRSPWRVQRREGLNICTRGEIGGQDQVGGETAQDIARREGRISPDEKAGYRQKRRQDIARREGRISPEEKAGISPEEKAGYRQKRRQDIARREGRISPEEKAGYHQKRRQYITRREGRISPGTIVKRLATEYQQQCSYSLNPNLVCYGVAERQHPNRWLSFKVQGECEDMANWCMLAFQEQDRISATYWVVNN